MDKWTILATIIQVVYLLSNTFTAARRSRHNLLDWDTEDDEDRIYSRRSHRRDYSSLIDHLGHKSRPFDRDDILNQVRSSRHHEDPIRHRRHRHKADYPRQHHSARTHNKPVSRDSYLHRRHRHRHEWHKRRLISHDPSLYANCGIRLPPQSGDSNYDTRSSHQLHKRIIGGSEAVPNSWPWQVFLRYKKDKTDRQCSGTLVTKRWFITSAQCIVSKDPKDYRVRLGEHNLLKISGKESFLLVSKIIVPPIYNSAKLVNDIALVELAKEAKTSSHVNYACLPAHASYVRPGTKCYMTGWGRMKASSGFKIATSLQQLKLTILDEGACQTALKKLLLSSQMCAGSNDWRGGCKYDEGSPLVCYDTAKRHWVFQGLFSFSGSSCSSTVTRYSVFTRVSPYVNAFKNVFQQSKPTRGPSTAKGKTTKVAKTTIATTPTPASSSTPGKKMKSSTIKVPPIPTKIAPPPVVTTKSKTTFTPTKHPVITKAVTTKEPEKHFPPVHLSIHLRSEGCDDLTKTDTCGRSYIVVNGIDYSQHKQGHNVVVVDYKTGKVESTLSFDTSKDLNEALKLLRFLKALGLRKVVLVAVQGDGSKYEGVLQKELVKFGATLPGEISYRSSFCLLGYSGPDKVPWIRQSSMPRYKGPSEIFQELPLPNPVKVVRIRARSESCSPSGDGKLCGKSYIWVNGIDHSKHIQGHNIAILDFDKGVVETAQGYKAKSRADMLAMKKVLNNLPFRKIVIVVMQGDATDLHAIARQCLGKYGASSVIELTSYSTYAFIGYSGPERVSWTTEKWKPRGLGATDVSVYIRKGLYVCGLQYLPPVSVSPFVVGGSISREGAWPWMGAIIDGNGRFICGSTLIHHQWVLTAAHCLRLMKQRPGPFRIALGHNSYISRSAVKIKIGKIIQHPHYNRKTHSNDLALLKLEKEAPAKEKIRLLCLNEHDQFKTGKSCYIVGWGRVKQDGAQSIVLREAKVPLVSDKVCNGTRSYRGQILSNMLCAGFEQGGRDACQGDSGGPLACQNRDGYWFLTGIVSWGHGCAQPHLYGVYVKVSAVAPWIKKTIAKES